MRPDDDRMSATPSLPVTESAPADRPRHPRHPRRPTWRPFRHFDDPPGVDSYALPSELALRPIEPHYPMHR